MITVKPVAFVRGGPLARGRRLLGQLRAEIVLADDLPAESLDGLETFSHAEIVFFFDKLEESARRDRRAPSSRKHRVAEGRHLRAAREGASQPPRRDHRRDREAGGPHAARARLDAVDGTPVIDIKPVIVEFLPRTPVRQPAWVARG